MSGNRTRVYAVGVHNCTQVKCIGGRHLSQQSHRKRCAQLNSCVNIPQIPSNPIEINCVIRIMEEQTSCSLSLSYTHAHSFSLTLLFSCHALYSLVFSLILINSIFGQCECDEIEAKQSDGMKQSFEKYTSVFDKFFHGRLSQLSIATQHCFPFLVRSMLFGIVSDNSTIPAAACHTQNNESQLEYKLPSTSHSTYYRRYFYSDTKKNTFRIIVWLLEIKLALIEPPRQSWCGCLILVRWWPGTFTAYG